MIRIGTNRCGYTGYTCRGIPQLHGSHEAVVEGTTITVQHMFNEANELVSAMRQEFDKLPLRIKGMVFAADTINMGWPEGGPHPEVPEISCRYDTDPFSISKKVAEQSSQIAVAINGQTYQYPVFGSTNGWVDLFNACDVAGGTDGYCYRRDVFLEKTLDTEEGGVTVKGHTLALVDNIPAFVSGNTEYIMGPGLLEPMLDTDFDPIDIDTIPAWEAGDDSFIFTTTVLGAWKAVVDDRFRNVYARLNNIPTAATDYNLRDLKREEYENTDCQNFRINLSSGDSLQTRGNQVANLYTVTDGQVAVDDYSVYVSGDVFTVEPGMDYPIYVWVRVYETDGTGETTTAEIILLDDSYDIGDELSGGEVIAKEQISVPGSVYRYRYTVQFDDGRKYTGLLFFGFPLPDADDHVVVVGGVRKVFGGTDDDSFVLFKIFQTECSPVMNFASDAETGLHGVIDFDIDGNEIITPLPGSTITPAPGIVQPAVNIALIVNGSTETNTQSTTDVPTVEAVYNFIHGITAYNGPVADAKATEVELSGISGSTVFGEPVDYVIPISKDRWAQNTEDEISGYTAAASMYEAAKAAWELAGEPTEGEIYEAYIEASTVYSDAYYTVYGDVSDGEPGTTYVINNIVLMNGAMMGVSATTAPSVRAVYNFVHDIYALSTAGTILVNEQNVPYVSHGTPGTVFTIDSLDKARYEAEEYYQDEVPTVKAVMDYVKMEGATSSTVGIIGYTTNQPEVLWPIPGSTVSPSDGYVQNVRNIYVSGTHSVSGYAVPTVDAVYNFIHNVAVEGMTFSSALATGGTVGNAYPSDTWKLHSVPGSTPTCYTFYRNRYSVVQVEPGQPMHVVATIGNATPGTLYVIDTIVNNGGSNVDVKILTAADPETTVPSVTAVYDFVHNMWALAVPGTPGETTEGSLTVKVIKHGIPGTVFTVDTVDTQYLDKGISGYYYDEVPTVRAVIQYVEGRACPGAVNGIISVNAGTESLASVQGTTAAAGIVQPVKNIDIGTQDPNAVSPTAVPTVQAVYDFIHGYTITDYKVADAKATADETIAVAGSTVQVKCGTSAVPGTFYVTNDMTNITDTVTTYVAPEAVPTAMSVVNYIRAYVAGHTATAARISVSDDSPYESLDAVHTTGTVDVSRCINLNLTINKRPESSRVVPTVEAVYNFVHDISDFYSGSSMSVQSSQATRGTITGTTTGTSPVITGATASGCTVGTYKVVGNIVGATNAQGGLFSVDDVVPTADAVVKYIKSLNLDPAGMAVSGNLNQYGDWVTASTVSAGIYFVATNVVAGTAGSAAYTSVPTVRAVNDFVAGYTASVGGFSVTVADKEDWETVGTGTSATKRKADPGIVGIVDTLVAATTVSNRSLSVKTVPTVAAVKDYVDTHTASMAISGSLTDGGDWTTISASTVRAGSTYIATNIVAGTAGSMAYTAVPTVRAVNDFVAGYMATGGTIYAPLDTEETWVSGHTSTAGIVLVSNNVAMTDAAQNRAVSHYAVPTVEAVATYVDTLLCGTTAGHLAPASGPGESIIDAVIGRATVSRNIYVDPNAEYRGSVAGQVVPTVEAVYAFVKGETVRNQPDWSYSDAHATGGTIGVSETRGSAHIVTGVTASGCKPGTCDIVSNIIGATNTTTGEVFSVTNVLPTADAVVKYVNATLKPIAVTGTIQIGTGGVEELWETDPPTAAGIVQPVNNILIGTDAGHAESSKDVPTVLAVYEFVHNYNTANIASPMAVPVDMHTIGNAATVGITASTSTPGTFFVTGNMAVVAGATAFPAPAVVPTAEAVAKYIKDNAASKYDGPFAAVSGSSIRGGNVYFGGALFATASDYTTALAANTTYWCVAKKNGSTKTAEIKTGPGTSVYEASVPIVRTAADKTPTQIHYGDINIEGRWA